MNIKEGHGLTQVKVRTGKEQERGSDFRKVREKDRAVWYSDSDLVKLNGSDAL